jgi:hypothetical protein
MNAATSTEPAVAPAVTSHRLVPSPSFSGDGSLYSPISDRPRSISGACWSAVAWSYSSCVFGSAAPRSSTTTVPVATIGKTRSTWA